MNNKRFYVYFNLSTGAYEVYFKRVESPILSYFGAGIKK